MKRDMVSLAAREAVRPLARASFPPPPAVRTRTITEIGRIQLVLASDANRCEQGVAAGIGQPPHALGIGGFGYRADQPMRGDPFARGVGQHPIRFL
jgi:hypothetical protein